MPYFDDPSQESVDEAFDRAMDMMRGSGFNVSQAVGVVVDNKLDIMGYTRPERDGNLIVVSENALKSGFVEGLLVHEIAHIYRSSINHPSHNRRIFSSVLRKFSRKLKRDYQKDAVIGIMNHLEDLYADDIAFMALINGKALSPSMLGRFIQGWVKEKPARTGNSERDRWNNAIIMLSNSFAISNMERHSLPDANFRARDTNLKFLYAINPSAAERFGYFNRLMVGMRDDIGDKEFKAMLEEYVRTFLEVVKAI